MVAKGVIGMQTVSDGAERPLSLDNYGAQKTQQFNGKYAELARRGFLYNYSVKAGAALLLAATTGNCVTIWNPAGSGKMLYVLSLRVSFLSGTTTISSLLWAITKNAGTNIATGGPILTFTDAAVEPAIVGAPFASAMRFAPATVTFTTAPSFLMATGINLGAVSPSAGSGSYEADFDGTLGIMPGNAISLCASVTTTTSTWWTTILGAEMPLVDGK